MVGWPLVAPETHLNLRAYLDLRGMARLYQFHAGPFSPFQEQFLQVNSYPDSPGMLQLPPSQLQSIAISRSETCFFVGDMFESWCLASDSGCKRFSGPCTTSGR